MPVYANELMETHTQKNLLASLLSAQWMAPLMQFLSECHWLISAPRTAPALAPRLLVYNCCRAVLWEGGIFLKGK